MRVFAVIAHKFSGDIRLNDLPGSGRVDVIARAINSAIFLSHDIRRDVLFYMYAPKIGFVMKIDSSRVRYLNPDERSTAALIRNAVINHTRREETSPGFFAREATMEEFLDEISSLGEFYLLHEEGDDIRNMEIPRDAVFLLSDSVDLSEDEMREVEGRISAKISVGPKSILASHAICIVNNEMDRRGL